MWFKKKKKDEVIDIVDIFKRAKLFGYCEIENDNEELRKELENLKEMYECAVEDYKCAIEDYDNLLEACGGTYPD